MGNDVFGKFGITGGLAVVNSLKITGAALVIFAAGVLTGGLAARLSQRSIRPPRAEPAWRQAGRVAWVPEPDRRSLDFPASPGTSNGQNLGPSNLGLSGAKPGDHPHGDRHEPGDGRGGEGGRRSGPEFGVGGGLGRPPTATRLDHLARVVGQLGLTPEQEQNVQRILEAGRERLAQQWAPVSVRMRDEIRQIRNEVNQVLTPAQQRQLEEALRPKPGGEPRAMRPDRGDRVR